MATQDELKRVAAEKAAELVPKNECIGTGTGSTINIFIETLDKGGKQIKGAVSTSVKSSEPLTKYDIPEVSLSDVPGSTVYVDGADEVNRILQMIKGGGGAHLNGKTVASTSDKSICIADGSKYVSHLGKLPLPVEVIPYARSPVSRKLVAMGDEPELRVGFTIFNGNQIVDVYGLHVNCLVNMEDEIDRITGVVEDGIFSHNAADVLIPDTEQDAKVVLPGQN